MELRELVTGVDGEDHALLTVSCLAAVHPGGIGVFDAQQGNWKVVGHGISDGNARNDESQWNGENKGKNETYNPESKPPSAGAHGLARVDWVAVWFFCLNVNCILSPTLAFCSSKHEMDLPERIIAYVPQTLGRI